MVANTMLCNLVLWLTADAREACQTLLTYTANQLGESREACQTLLTYTRNQLGAFLNSAVVHHTSTGSIGKAEGGGRC